MRKNVDNKPIVALIYDFDGTLAPGNMQEYSFIKSIGLSKEEFWGKTQNMAQIQDADPILIYMLLMLNEAQKNNIELSRESFRKFGKDITFFEGVESWFGRINKIGEREGIRVEHYINSSGLLEILEGTSIAKEFKAIFASCYYYSKKGNAVWPASAVNYTNKTQFLFKINKGILNIQDSEKTNESTPDEEKRVAFKNMIYFGDGETDVPCMKLIKQLGGTAIGVYDPSIPRKKTIAQKLIHDNRVNFICAADYSKGKKVEQIVRNIIRKIKADEQLAKFR